MRRLSLDLIPLLLLVLRGRVLLVGNHIKEFSDANRESIKNYKGYRAGVFSLSSSKSDTIEQFQVDMDDRYYNSVRSFKYDMKIIFESFKIGFKKRKDEVEQ